MEHKDDGSAGPDLEVKVDVVIAEVIHVFFGYCFLVFCALLESEVLSMTVLL